MRRRRPDGRSFDSRVAARPCGAISSHVCSWRKACRCCWRGDEGGNSQDGNNNAYCQDNETGWVDWSRLGSDDDLTGFVGELTRLRHRFPQLKPHHWVVGKRPDGTYDVKWLTPKGAEMGEADWNFPDGRFLAYVLGAVTEGGEPLLVVLNGADEAVDITGPEWPAVARWERVIDTANGQSNSATLELEDNGRRSPGPCWLLQACREQSARLISDLQPAAHRQISSQGRQLDFAKSR